MKHNYKLSWKFPQIAIVVLLLFCTISTAPAQTILPAEDIAEKALAATVYLEMKDKNGKTLGIGSGFFVRHNLIATNYHVIEGAAKGTAKLVGKSTTYKIEGVTATDKTNDLALLKVTAYRIKPLSLGNSDSVKIGATVYVAGNPKGLEGTFSDGIISSRRAKDTKERLQMTAPISPGSSGGPVLNRKGEVIGVSFAGHPALDAQNLNFAIPSKYLKKLLEQSKPPQPLSQGKQSISAETYFQWGNAKYQLGQYEAAIAYYNKAIRLKLDAANIYNIRGFAKTRLDLHVTAISDFDEAIRLKPDYAIAYSGRGIAKASLEQHFAAILDYDIAIKLKPDSAMTYTNRASSKASLDQYLAAISDYDIAIKLKPNDAKIYYNRGTVKGRLGEHFSAISDFTEAIRIKPDDAASYYNRGISKASLDQYLAAISDYDIAIKLKPNDAKIYYNRGHAKVQLDQYLAAIADYDTAIKLKPDYAKAYAGRGVAKALLDRTLEAKQDLRTALTLAEKAGDAGLIDQVKETLRLIK